MKIDSYNSRSSLMNYKSNSLFSDWEMMPRKTVNQSTFEANLYEFSASIVSAIELGMMICPISVYNTHKQVEREMFKQQT